MQRSLTCIALALGLAACTPSTTPQAAAPKRAEKPAPPEPEFGAPAHGTLLPGRECTDAPMPGWVHDEDRDRLRLTQGDIAMRVPEGWRVRIARPDLAVLWAPRSTDGVRPVFEVFVSPLCKTYQTAKVHLRVAVRGLLELLPPEDALRQVASGKWPVGLGGPTGTSLIVVDVLLHTRAGDRNVILYATDFAKSQTFGVRTAAVCPRKPASTEMGACEQAYFAMLDSARTAK